MKWLLLLLWVPVSAFAADVEDTWELTTDVQTLSEGEEVESPFLPDTPVTIEIVYGADGSMESTMVMDFSSFDFWGFFFASIFPDPSQVDIPYITPWLTFAFVMSGTYALDGHLLTSTVSHVDMFVNDGDPLKYFAEVAYQIAP